MQPSEVLPILLKINGKLFPSPTQLLPEVGAGTNGLEVLDSLSSALKGIMPDPNQKVVTTSETWTHKQYRQATKILLLGLANSLQQIMPNGWKMSDLKPKSPLVPRGSLTREKLLQQEVMLLKPNGDDMAFARQWHFLWSGDGDQLIRKIDFYVDPASFYRLCFSGDEGTDVSCY